MPRGSGADAPCAGHAGGGTLDDMTTIETSSTEAAVVPPYSTRIRQGLGVCLVLGGLLNGGSQYLVEAVAPDHDGFGDQFRWGLEHPALHQGEQFALMASMLFLPLGLLAIAQVTRWHTPRLTAVSYTHLTLPTKALV